MRETWGCRKRQTPRRGRRLPAQSVTAFIYPSVGLCRSSTASRQKPAGCLLAVARASLNKTTTVKNRPTLYANALRIRHPYAQHSPTYTYTYTHNRQM